MKQWDMLVQLLKDKPHLIGAEIGVFRGECASQLLKKLPDLQRLYCVDLWKHYPDFTKILKPGGRYLNVDFEDVFQEYQRVVEIPYPDRVQTLRMTSEQATKFVHDMTLDFVFIDANHAYEYVKQDILLWSQKVNFGGLIAGHDYGKDDIKPGFGVTKAVDELLPNAIIEKGLWYIYKEK